MSSMHTPITETSGERKKHNLVNFLLWANLQLIFAAFFLLASSRRIYNQLAYRVAAAGLHHHRSPQLIRGDVAKLSKVPQHIAVILSLGAAHGQQGGVEGLLHNVGEITGWCIGAGARELSVYERTGALKSLPLQDIVREVKDRLESYFGVDGVPNFEICRSNGEPAVFGTGASSSSTFKINLLSEKDGRPVIVELARTFAQFARNNEIEPNDITVDFVDREMQALVGREPDLVIMFGPRVDLQGFPPWHIRVSEIFYLPDNQKVSYLVFKRALEKFAGSKINLGK